MGKDITLTIDNQQVTVPAGTLVVDAAKKIGIDIPVFCYHPKMEPVGMCRMCLVEIGRPMFDRATGEPVLDENGEQKIQWGWKLETGCTVPVSEGMVVRGYTDTVKKGRSDILEFLLTSHPLDCPICDKGGECPLQNLTMAHGKGNGRFLLGDKIHFDKNVPLGDLITLDRERCIQCARCIRFQREIVDDPVIQFYNRGRATDIITTSEPGFDSYWSGNTTDLCPVGALTTTDFRFRARSWELNQAASLCTHCPVGCNTTFNIRREAKSGGKMTIKRVMPRQNEKVNEIWLCDKGRFAYHYTASEDRLTQPLVRVDGELTPATWGEALDLVAGKVQAAGENLLALATGRLTNEDLFNLNQLAAHQGGTAALHTYMAGGDLTPHVGVGAGTNLADLGAGDAILVVASDLEEEAPLWWLRVKQAVERGAALIVANPRKTKLDRYAAHKIRYSYGEETTVVKRIANPSNGEETDAVKQIANPSNKAFAEAKNAVVFFGSHGVGLEGSGPLAQACADFLAKTGHVNKANNGLIGVWPRANTQGAWDMGFRPAADLGAALSASSVLYAAAADPVGDNPALADAVQAAGFVIVQDLFLTETAKLADVVLPAQAYTEREGSYTTGERRVQRFYQAVPALTQTRADYTIFAQVAHRLGLELEGRYPTRVMKQIAEAVPAYAGLSYTHLAQTEAQWPIIGRGDVYYGGTTYDNAQGMGVKLATSAAPGDVVERPEDGLSAHAEMDGLLAVPVTRLYDRGRTVLPSAVLQARIPDPHIALNPADAAKAGVQAGAEVVIQLNGISVRVGAYVHPAVPEGVALVPRSMGMPIDGPAPIAITVAEKATA